MQAAVEGSVVRGGTSKGVFFRRRDLPPDESAWDEVLLDLFGSPDPMQIDGIGGSHSVTSKTIIAWNDPDVDADVSYQFGQVGIEKPVVDWGGNCGNLTFGVGPFALEANIATPEDPLVLRNTNTGTTVEQEVRTDDRGEPVYTGDFDVDGIPGTGSRIRSRFLDPAGTETGELFPTGNRVDTMDVPGLGEIEVSLVDVSNPVVFVRAEDVGMQGGETPTEIDDSPARETLERVRSVACEWLGLVDDASEATERSPGLPKVGYVGEPSAFETSFGETVPTEEFDVLARVMSMQKAHHAYPVTGGMCTAATAMLQGTVPYEQTWDEDPGDRSEVTIGHPKGTMTVGVGIGDRVEYTRVDRTAREIMAGDIYYERSP
ncbi:MAG: PrpF domain-containing protein [Haloferacaceae archaeon]